MATKTAIVASVRHIESKPEGPYGPQEIFEIGFDNGDAGRYYGKTNPQNKFVEGQSAEYTIESKQNGNYTNYYIKPVKQAGGFGGGGYKPNEKAANARVALQCATTLKAAGDIKDSDDFKKVRDSFLAWLNKASEL